MTITKHMKRDLDKLAKLVKHVSPERLRTALVKDERIALRVTALDKSDIERMASHYGVNVTEYFLMLHELASGLHPAIQERRKRE